VRKCGRLINWDFLSSQVLSKKIIGWIMCFVSFYILIYGVYETITTNNYLGTIALVMGILTFFTCAKVKIQKQETRSVFHEVFEDY